MTVPSRRRDNLPPSGVPNMVRAKVRDHIWLSVDYLQQELGCASRMFDVVEMVGRVYMVIGPPEQLGSDGWQYVRVVSLGCASLPP